jgi:hypothetical protein
LGNLTSIYQEWSAGVKVHTWLTESYVWQEVEQQDYELLVVRERKKIGVPFLFLSSERK